MARIIFRPTCSRCQRILENVTVDFGFETLHHVESIYEVATFSTHPRVEPSQCPYCGERFDLIVEPVNESFPIRDSELMRYR